MKIKYYNEKILLNEFKDWHNKMYHTNSISADEIDHFLAKKWLEIEKDTNDTDITEDIILKFKDVLTKTL